MFVKPTQLIGKKEKGIENRTNEEKGEKAKKRRKNRKHPGLTQKKGKQRKKKQSLDLIICSLTDA